MRRGRRRSARPRAPRVGLAGVLRAGLLGCLLWAATGAAPLAAQERILSYDTRVEILADGDLVVTERIAVHAAGEQIRRGIYRDFPTRYRDRAGNLVRVELEVLGVERNGLPEPWFTERRGNGVRINTGDDTFLDVPGVHLFTLRYRTSHQLGFFAEHDELYWNAIGAGWIFPIESGTVEVLLPEPVPIERMSAEAYTGPQGSRGAAYTASLPEPGVARFALTAPLAPREAFTVVVTFPKGMIPEPTRQERAGRVLADNRGVLVALVGLGLFLLYCVREWRRVGRDPRPGVVVPRYHPPAGHTPAGLRYLRRMGYDMRCFSGDLLALAVGGQLRISRDKTRFRDDWSLERTGASADSAALAQRTLLERLFPAGASSLELKNTSAATVSHAQQGHQRELDRVFHPHYFERNVRSVVVAGLLLVLTGGSALWLSSEGYGVPLVLGVVAAMAVGLVVFARLVRAPTAEGRALLDEIEGLRMYLGVAERDEIAGLEGPGGERPPLDAARYEALLPYAVALEVEDAWTRKFTAAVGAAAAATAASGIAWYAGRGPITDLGSFSRAMGKGLSSQISSAATPPGSSSGSGGGGSSGGGGGGGGGGGR